MVGLSALPASLTKLRSLAWLDVSGNKLDKLSPIVAALPKLERVDIGSTDMAGNEQRLVNALIKLPATKRAAALAKAAARN